MAITILCIPSSTVAYTRPPTTTIDWIEYWASEYNVSTQDMISVAICESNLYPKAFNKTDGVGGSRGIFQYQQSTWDYFSAELGEKLDVWSVYDQAKLTAYMFSKDRQFHWACAKILKIV